MTKLKPLLIGLVGAGVLAASGYGLYNIGMQRGMGMADAAVPSAGAVATPANVAPGAVPQSVAEGEDATRRHIEKGIKAGDVDPTTGRKILYYHDPMVPGNKFDQPAKSPFMDMMLVPVYADGDAGSDGSKVTVSPRIQQNLGVRTAEVTEGLLNHIEVAIRAFDPCLSCATHALGQMPLEVELVDADGRRGSGVVGQNGEFLHLRLQRPEALPGVALNPVYLLAGIVHVSTLPRRRSFMLFMSSFEGASCGGGA